MHLWAISVPTVGSLGNIVKIFRRLFVKSELRSTEHVAKTERIMLVIIVKKLLTDRHFEAACS